MPYSLHRTAAPPAAALALLLVAIPARGADGLDLRRVLLSTGGVGYFEYEATVSGDATLTLDVRRDQVDDVLKSIVVYDDAGGVGTIALPGEAPLAQAFRELPFDAAALESPAALLTALRGAEVRVTGAREVTGRLLSVNEDTVELPDGRGTLTRHRITLMTAAGLRQLVLEDTESLRFADPALQAQVDGALAALAEHGGRERRRLSIRTTGGDAPRTVRVGYVVEAPLWKTSYRLTLPPEGDGAGALQGWAVLENMSGVDWNAVDLTVVSGSPVTFRQALYESYYVDRPEVPVEVPGRVLPSPDEGAVPMAAVPQRAKGGAADEADAARSSMMRAGPRAESMPPAPAPAPSQPAALTTAEARDAATQVVFRYPQPVTVAAGQSLMLPVVARPVPAAAVGLYRPDTHARHPLAAVRVANDTGSGLPPGVLTLYERGGADAAVAYVGDARLSAMPAGEERLLSFALDRTVTVDRADRPSRTLTRAAIVDGVLTLTVEERQTTTYTIAAAAGAPRTVIVEHPRRPGWDLAEPAGPEPAVTADSYRLPVSVAAGGTASLTVVLRHPRVERVALIDLVPEQVAAYADAEALAPPLREALDRVAALRSTLADRQRRIAEVEREQVDVLKDQERLRTNLAALPRDSDLYRRTLDKMGEQETRLESLTAGLADARREAEAARRALADFVRGLNL
ncbi:DUF4139 domain-containing protein [Azospirillum halopraeferens]|uniref:DUF4139 domain-containing protein n=1 Tax=Azospirillum halopraeferens TaxID=34010 RepID=UPI00040B63DC|nr:DUF4139 domain-containing protein [Azospirillum halopraeferens]